MFCIHAVHRICLYIEYILTITVWEDKKKANAMKKYTSDVL